MLNTSSNLYKSEWLDLVFKNRNKNYGAYVLRAESAGTTLRALFIAAPIFILLFAGPMIYKHFNPVVESKMEGGTVVTVRQNDPPLEMVKPKEKQEVAAAEPIKEKIKTVALPSNPKVVADPIDQPEPPTIDDLKNAAVGPVTQSGVETNLASVPSAGTGNGLGLGKGEGGGGGGGEDNAIHEYNGGLEVFPEFEGGMKAWAKFLQRNLRYPTHAEEIGIQGKVFISFVVEKDGSVSNVTLVKGIGGGCDEEAVRVIKKSPKWKPGKQNDQSVRVRYQMPLSFAIAQ